jgi:outer membrane protein assembly factor BamD
VKKIYYIIFLLIFCLNFSCSKDIKNKSIINEKNLDLQVLEAYEEGMKSLDAGDVLFAAKKFNEVEILYPQSEWAPKSSIMAAYAYYSQDYYDDAISELTRFIKVYPRYKDIDYVYYLLGISFYEQIVDEKKDLQSLVNAKKNFEIIQNKYSESEYVLDSNFKIDLINDILAAKEIYIGRYYLDQKKWIAAINRFKVVIDEYETTIYTEEALHRLVEVHYIIGLIDEAEKYAKFLGYNYQSSEWYEKSYIVFNKIYEENKKISLQKDKEKNNSILRKFKSLFNFDE